MSPLELVIYVALAAVGLLYFFGKKNRKNYPPGPWGMPILGHLPFMGSSPHLKIAEWAKAHGPVMSVEFGSFPTVVISDPKLVRTAFNEVEFSGRPDFESLKDRSEGTTEGVIFTDGKKWLEQRRFIIRTLRDFGFGKQSMETAVQEEIKELIESFRKVVGIPQSTQNRFNAAVLNALWTLIAGERFKHDDPELQTAIKHLTSNVQNQRVAAQISVFIPIICKLAPKLSGYNKLIEDIFPILDFLRKPIQQHKDSIQIGQPRDFIDVFLEEIHKTKDPQSSFYKEQGEKSVLYSVFDLFLAGAETTSTTLTWTFLYMAKYPHVQKKLQAEIQKVVGNSRLPSLSDRPSMPYTEAVLHEIMRFSTLTPIGVAHNSMKEITFDNYIIPKDTMILANVYGIHFDEKIWGDPFTFRPERFLSKDGSTFVKHEAFIAFSVGKRACLGESLARDELFLFTTSLFQAFTVAPSTTAEELSILPSVGAVLSPMPHELILKERD